MSDLQPMTLLDLDAAGLDPTKLAAPEFIAFLFDNSQVMYLTLWSHILAEPDGASKITRWLDASVAAYRQRQMQVQVAPATAEKPAGDHITEVTYTGPVVGPPVNVNVPLLSGPNGINPADVGQTLNCTMGNWEGAPENYAYQFAADSANVSGTDNTYVVAAGDAGKSITCLVTATNSGGATPAPPSNAILVAGARSAGTSRSADDSRRDDPKVSGTAAQERTTRRST